MKVYLDNNILVSIEDNEIELSELRNIFGQEAQFVYSYIHLLELLKAKKNFESLKKIRIETLKEVCQNQYIFQETDPNLNSLFDYKIENPDSVLNVIRTFNLNSEEFKDKVNRFDLIDRNKLIESLSIDIKRINNYSEKEVIEHIDTALRKKLHLHIDTFIDLMGSQLNSKIRTIFNLLDLLGYWKDKKSTKANLARLYDASHAYYASGCDVFLSNDTRACKKTRVTFKLFEIETNVYDWKEINK